MSTNNSEVKVGLGVSIEVESLKLDDEIAILRLVKNTWIKEDRTLSTEAYRPRKRPLELTGFEKNVSTVPLTCYPTAEAQEKYTKSWERRSLYQTFTKYPHKHGYPCIQDKDCHIGISGDMERLHGDNEALKCMASNSSVIYITKK